MPDIQRDARTVKWYLKPLSVFIAIAAVGPLAIPLVWMSPAFKRWQKMVLTMIVILLTLWMLKASVDLYRIFLKEFQGLQAALK